MSSTFGGRPSRFDPDAGPSPRRAVILPGAVYSPDAPLLDFGRLALLQHGWTVQQVWWEDPGGSLADRAGWVADQLESAAAAEAERAPTLDRLLAMAKSLGTLAAAGRTTVDAAVWFTPLLTDSVCVAGIERRAKAGVPQLLVGGTADELWVSRTAHGLGCDVLEVDGADHALTVPGDAVRTAEVHAEVTAAVHRFLAALG